MNFRCCVCGKDVNIDCIKGKDKRFYVDIQSKIFLRLRNSESLYVICKDCVEYLNIID
jgi:hypothetical protein